jgi:hypothetical protein
MGSSPGFGSHRRDSSPFRTRFRSGSACPWLNLATPMHSSAHSTKGTPSPSHLRDQAPTGRKRTVSGALSLPLNGVLFTIPSRYWFPIGRLWYLALDGGPPRFPPDITCPVVLTKQSARVRPARRLRGSHPLRRPVPAAFGCTRRNSSARGDCRPLPDRRSTPPPQRRQATNTELVWAPPRSLAATRGILSLPRGTEMFQFPRCPPHPTTR